MERVAWGEKAWVDKPDMSDHVLHVPPYRAQPGKDEGHVSS
jgi:hypothetical protein